MPSPIAHCSMVALIRPLHERGLLPGALMRHRRALLALMLFGCVMPDIDFAIAMVAPGTPLGMHGYGMHSVFSTAALSLVLALGWQLLFRGGFFAVLLLCIAASWSHLFFDAMTYRSRGIGVLWPLIDERMRLPWDAFYGVRHDQPLAWREHLVTVVSETAFFMIVWFGTLRLTRSTRPTIDKTTPEANGA